MTSNRIFVRPWLIALVVLASSCSDPSPTGADLATPGLMAGKVRSTTPSFVQCSPVAYDSVSQVIGPTGGWFVVGANVLWVDSLALSSPVKITAVAPSDTIRWVRLYPEGLVFNTGTHGLGAVVATNLNNCKLRRNTIPRIANVTDAMALVEYVESPMAAVDSMLIARFRTDSGGWTPYWAFGALHHFSNYAVAW
jgi:ribosomal protein S30